LWRLILSQSTQGHWDATSTVAFALEARSLAEVATLQSTWWTRLKDRLADASDVVEDLLSDGMSGARGAAHQAVEQAADGQRAARRSSVAAAPGGPAEVSDDPLFCTPSAILAAMPRRLSALRAEDGPLVDRVWATMCVIAFLETLNVSWLWTSGDLYPEREVTVVDQGRLWVEAHATEHPALQQALADGALAQAVARTVTLWHRAWEERINELRRQEAIMDHVGISHAHRASTELMRAVCTKHGTVRLCSTLLLRVRLTPPTLHPQFSVFLSAPALEGLQRWQLWMVLVTLVIAQLLVNSACCRAGRSAQGRAQRAAACGFADPALLRSQYGCSTPRE
jgi:hypothetical protein